VLSLFAVGLTWGLLRFNPLRLLRHGRHKSTKNGSRKSLAVPGLRPRRILRRLNRPEDSNGQAQKPPSNNGKVGQAEFRQAEAVNAK
jgi:hypothetical protein